MKIKGLGFGAKWPPNESSSTAGYLLSPFPTSTGPDSHHVDPGYGHQVSLAALAVAEERLGAAKELLLPFADLDRVDLEGPGLLRQDPALLGGLGTDLGLKAAEFRLRMLAMILLGKE
jgi:hypothetical protein